jgi:hypothetical protein
MDKKVSEILFNKKLCLKQDYLLFYDLGLLGNKAIAWNSLDEIIASKWKDSICIRPRKKSTIKVTKYDVPLKDAKKEIEEMVKLGIKQEDIAFNQSMPNKHLLIQGEVMITEKGLTLFYTLAKKPMNLGFQEHSAHAFGLQAKMILEKYFYPSTLSDIQALFDNFPDSIIEFSCYSVPVGNIPGRNTVIWEVRNY